MAKQQEYLLVGDHLGQVKKISLLSNEVSLLTGCAAPNSSNPVVSICPIGTKHLIANKNGNLYIYEEGSAKAYHEYPYDALIKALPINYCADNVLLVCDKQIVSTSGVVIIKQKKKREEITNAQVDGNKLAFVGKDIPLKLFDIETQKKLFEADPPEKDWLGIKPDVYVADLTFVDQTHVATCSKSDSVIRVYDTRTPKPAILVDINQTAFNEHADSARFHSVASTGNKIVVGSNVGQILAVDLRFNVKKLKQKKKMQPRAFKILGGFKGARGASIRDLKILPDAEDGDRVVSCCLDRYLRIHNFKSRQLDRHVYLTTKPLCVSACVD